MAITDTDRRETYADEYVPGQSEDQRASEHRQIALDVLAEGGSSHVAVVHALLAVAERISELSVHVSQLG